MINTPYENQGQPLASPEVITQASILEDALTKIEPPPAEVLSNYESYRITDRTAIPEPVPIIRINGETISTEGNITTISGPPKSGKSAITNILLAGAISDNGIVDGHPDMKVDPNIAYKAVIHFDTEQARHKHQQNVKDTLRRVGYDTCPPYYYSYNIRQCPINDYREITRQICLAANQRHHGTHLIVVDGIADYIADVNEAEDANDIVKFFEELAIELSCPVIVIVHTNPNGEKERGHLGSQAQRKCESLLRTKTEGEISILDPIFLRMAGRNRVPSLQFKYDFTKGYHIGHGVKSNVKPDKDEKRLALIKEACISVFSGQKAFEYNDAVEAIMKEANRGERTAKDFFKEMKAHKWIVKGPDERWRITPSVQ